MVRCQKKNFKKTTTKLKCKEMRDGSRLMHCTEYACMCANLTVTWIKDGYH